MSEGFLDKFLRKAGRDPLVPVGCGATLACLLAGLYTFHTGQAALSQKMMRARVVAQGATIVVLAVGTFGMSLARDPAEQRPKGMHPIEFEALREAQAKEER
jgi:hypothetical protein